MKGVIISVSNKNGIVELTKLLAQLDCELYSTSGTKRVLEEANVTIKSVSELTQFPEIMGDRMKTLRLAVRGGVLADRNKPEHLEQSSEQHIDLIDMVMVNLYPFQQTVANPDVTEDDAVEDIDIGGPTILRAAAKSFRHVTTTVHPSGYNKVIQRIRGYRLDELYHRSLMIKVFGRTNGYDHAIVGFSKGDSEELRYSGNPQQSTCFIRTSDSKHTIAGIKQLHDKALSFNDIKDADPVLALVKKFREPIAVAVRYMNPCGVGIGADIEIALENAYGADNQPVFGGIIALDGTVTENLAETLHSIFLKVVTAPKFDKEALSILTQKKNIRLLEIDMTIDNHEEKLVSVSGGYLVRGKDNYKVSKGEMKVVADIEPADAQWEAMLLEWKVIPSVKSNTIILSNSEQTVGIGVGQMNRVGAAKIASERAIEINGNVVMISDRFFPVDDTAELAAKHGIKAIIRPDGSIKDQDSIDVANKHGIAVVATGMRRFKH